MATSNFEKGVIYLTRSNPNSTIHVYEDDPSTTESSMLCIVDSQGSSSVTCHTQNKSWQPYLPDTSCLNCDDGSDVSVNSVDIRVPPSSKQLDVPLASNSSKESMLATQGLLSVSKHARDLINDYLDQETNPSRPVVIYPRRKTKVHRKSQTDIHYSEDSDGIVKKSSAVSSSNSILSHISTENRAIGADITSNLPTDHFRAEASRSQNERAQGKKPKIKSASKCPVRRCHAHTWASKSKSQMHGNQLSGRVSSVQDVAAAAQSLSDALTTKLQGLLSSGAPANRSCKCECECLEAKSSAKAKRAENNDAQPNNTQCNDAQPNVGQPYGNQCNGNQPSLCATNTSKTIGNGNYHNEDLPRCTGPLCRDSKSFVDNCEGPLCCNPKTQKAATGAVYALSMSQRTSNVAACVGPTCCNSGSLGSIYTLTKNKTSGTQTPVETQTIPESLSPAPHEIHELQSLTPNSKSKLQILDTEATCPGGCHIEVRVTPNLLSNPKNEVLTPKCSSPAKLQKPASEPVIICPQKCKSTALNQQTQNPATLSDNPPSIDGDMHDFQIAPSGSKLSIDNERCKIPIETIKAPYPKYCKYKTQEPDNCTHSDSWGCKSNGHEKQNTSNLPNTCCPTIICNKKTSQGQYKDYVEKGKGTPVVVSSSSSAYRTNSQYFPTSAPNCFSPPEPQCFSKLLQKCNEQPEQNCYSKPSPKCIPKHEPNCDPLPEPDSCSKPLPKCIPKPTTECCFEPPPPCYSKPSLKCNPQPEQNYCSKPSLKCILKPKPNCDPLPEPDCNTQPEPDRCSNHLPKCIPNPKPECCFETTSQCFSKPSPNCNTQSESNCCSKPLPKCITKPKADCCLKPPPKCISKPEPQNDSQLPSEPVYEAESNCLPDPPQQHYQETQPNRLPEPHPKCYLDPSPKCCFDPPPKCCFDPPPKCYLDPSPECCFNPPLKCISKSETQCSPEPARKCIHINPPKCCQNPSPNCSPDPPLHCCHENLPKCSHIHCLEPIPNFCTSSPPKCLLKTPSKCCQETPHECCHDIPPKCYHDAPPKCCHESHPKCCQDTPQKCCHDTLPKCRHESPPKRCHESHPKCCHEPLPPCCSTPASTCSKSKGLKVKMKHRTVAVGPSLPSPTLSNASTSSRKCAKSRRNRSASTITLGTNTEYEHSFSVTKTSKVSASRGTSSKLAKPTYKNNNKSTSYENAVTAEPCTVTTKPKKSGLKLEKIGTSVSRLEVNTSVSAPVGSQINTSKSYDAIMRKSCCVCATLAKSKQRMKPDGKSAGNGSYCADLGLKIIQQRGTNTGHSCFPRSSTSCYVLFKKIKSGLFQPCCSHAESTNTKVGQKCIYVNKSSGTVPSCSANLNTSRSDTLQTSHKVKKSVLRCCCSTRDVAIANPKCSNKSIGTNANIDERLPPRSSPDLDFSPSIEKEPCFPQSGIQDLCFPPFNLKKPKRSTESTEFKERTRKKNVPPGGWRFNPLKRGSKKKTKPTTKSKSNRKKRKFMGFKSLCRKMFPCFKKHNVNAGKIACECSSEKFLSKTPVGTKNQSSVKDNVSRRSNADRKQKNKTRKDTPPGKITCECSSEISLSKTANQSPVKDNVNQRSHARGNQKNETQNEPPPGSVIPFSNKNKDIEENTMQKDEKLYSKEHKSGVQPCCEKPCCPGPKDNYQPKTQYSSQGRSQPSQQTRAFNNQNEPVYNSNEHDANDESLTDRAYQPSSQPINQVRASKNNVTQSSNVPHHNYEDSEENNKAFTNTMQNSDSRERRTENQACCEKPCCSGPIRAGSHPRARPREQPDAQTFTQPPSQPTSPPSKRSKASKNKSDNVIPLCHENSEKNTGAFSNTMQNLDSIERKSEKQCWRDGSVSAPLKRVEKQHMNEYSYNNMPPPEHTQKYQVPDGPVNEHLRRIEKPHAYEYSYNNMPPPENNQKYHVPVCPENKPLRRIEKPYTYEYSYKNVPPPENFQKYQVPDGPVNEPLRRTEKPQTYEYSYNNMPPPENTQKYPVPDGPVNEPWRRIEKPHAYEYSYNNMPPSEKNQKYQVPVCPKNEPLRQIEKPYTYEYSYKNMPPPENSQKCQIPDGPVNEPLRRIEKPHAYKYSYKNFPPPENSKKYQITDGTMNEPLRRIEKPYTYEYSYKNVPPPENTQKYQVPDGPVNEPLRRIEKSHTYESYEYSYNNMPPPENTQKYQVPDDPVNEPTGRIKKPHMYDEYSSRNMPPSYSAPLTYTNEDSDNYDNSFANKIQNTNPKEENKENQRCCEKPCCPGPRIRSPNNRNFKQKQNDNNQTFDSAKCKSEWLVNQNNQETSNMRNATSMQYYVNPNSCLYEDCQTNKNQTTSIESCANPGCPFRYSQTNIVQTTSIESCHYCPFDDQATFTESCGTPCCPFNDSQIFGVQATSAESCSYPDCPVNQDGFTENCNKPCCPLSDLKQDQPSFVDNCGHSYCPVNESQMNISSYRPPYMQSNTLPYQYNDAWSNNNPPSSSNGNHCCLDSYLPHNCGTVDGLDAYSNQKAHDWANFHYPQPSFQHHPSNMQPPGYHHQVAHNRSCPGCLLPINRGHLCCYEVLQSNDIQVNQVSPCNDNDGNQFRPQEIDRNTTGTQYDPEHSQDLRIATRASGPKGFSLKFRANPQGGSANAWGIKGHPVNIPLVERRPGSQQTQTASFPANQCDPECPKGYSACTQGCAYDAQEIQDKFTNTEVILKCDPECHKYCHKQNFNLEKKTTIGRPRHVEPPAGSPQPVADSPAQLSQSFTQTDLPCSQIKSSFRKKIKREPKRARAVSQTDFPCAGIRQEKQLPDNNIANLSTFDSASTFRSKKSAKALISMKAPCFKLPKSSKPPKLSEQEKMSEKPYDNMSKNKLLPDDNTYSSTTLDSASTGSSRKFKKVSIKIPCLKEPIKLPQQAKQAEIPEVSRVNTFKEKVLSDDNASSLTSLDSASTGSSKKNCRWSIKAPRIKQLKKETPPKQAKKIEVRNDNTSKEGTTSDDDDSTPDSATVVSASTTSSIKSAKAPCVKPLKAAKPPNEPKQEITEISSDKTSKENILSYGSKSSAVTSESAGVASPQHSQPAKLAKPTVVKLPKPPTPSIQTQTPPIPCGNICQQKLTTPNDSYDSAKAASVGTSLACKLARSLRLSRAKPTRATELPTQVKLGEFPCGSVCHQKLAPAVSLSRSATSRSILTTSSGKLATPVKPVKLPKAVKTQTPSKKLKMADLPSGGICQQMPTPGDYQPVSPVSESVSRVRFARAVKTLRSDIITQPPLLTDFPCGNICLQKISPTDSVSSSGISSMTAKTGITNDARQTFPVKPKTAFKLMKPDTYKPDQDGVISVAQYEKNKKKKKKTKILTTELCIPICESECAKKDNKQKARFQVIDCVKGQRAVKGAIMTCQCPPPGIKPTIDTPAWQYCLAACKPNRTVNVAVVRLIWLSVGRQGAMQYCHAEPLKMRGAFACAMSSLCQSLRLRPAATSPPMAPVLQIPEPPPKVTQSSKERVVPCVYSTGSSKSLKRAIVTCQCPATEPKPRGALGYAWSSICIMSRQAIGGQRAALSPETDMQPNYNMLSSSHPDLSKPAPIQGLKLDIRQRRPLTLPTWCPMIFPK